MANSIEQRDFSARNTIFMPKKEKYPRNLLLFPKSEKFLSVCKSSNSKSERELPYKLAKAINKKTLKLNKEIQLTLEKFFNGVRSTNLVQDIRKDDVEAKHQKQEEAEDGLLYYLIKKTSHQNEDIGLEKHSNSLFEAIRPRIIVLALNIGEAFEMDLEETEKMITCLRCISSERRNINDILQEKGFDPSRKCVKDINLKDICESIKELINPARYYVAEKTVGEQLKSLKKSLWKLKKAKFASINLNSQVAPEDITARQFFKATKKMIWFQDLSTVALWMSNALIPITDGKKTYHMLPKFLSNSIDALDHNLKHYYQKKMAEWLLGGELIEGGKKQSKDEGRLQSHRIEAYIQKNLTWETAESFLKKQVVVSCENLKMKDNSHKQSAKNYIKTNWESLYKKEKNPDIPETQDDNALIFDIFRVLLKQSCMLLEFKVLEVLLYHASVWVQSEEQESENTI